MTDELVQSSWDVRVMAGVLRVSGTELGRRLDYCVTDPTKFNKRVVEKSVKERKFNDSDIAPERSQCKKGFGEVEVTEYWLTLAAAYRIAMNVQTKAAERVRQRVIDQLLAMAGRPPTTLTAPSDQTVVMTRVLEAMESQTRTLTTTIERLFNQTPTMTEPSLCVDREQVRHLQGQARALGKATGKSLTVVWHEMSDHEGIRRQGKAFSTVLRSRFASVSDHLRTRLLEARAFNRSQVIEHPSAPVRDSTCRPKVDPTRLANEGTDIGVQLAAQRLTADLEYDVPWQALSRPEGIYAACDVDPLYLPPKGRVTKTKERPAPYLDESRYQYVLHWMRTNQTWAQHTIRLQLRTPLSA